MTVKKFTVIELLVVMAIIAVLIALLFPAMTSVIENSKITKTRAEAVALTNAIEHYLNTYYTLPLLASSNEELVEYGIGKDTGKYDELIVGLAQTVMTNLEENEISPGNEINARKIRFLNLSNQQTQTGYIDPWQNRYRVVFNAQMNRAGVLLNNNRVVGNVFVYSFGMNGDNNYGVGVDSPLRENNNQDDIPGWDM